MTDMMSVAPTLSTEQLSRLLALLEGADTVELKLTVPDGGHRSAVARLGMDPLDANLRQVFFFDTKDLLLDRHGVIVRARRAQGGKEDSVVKLRPVVPHELPGRLRELPDFGVEVDAMPGGFVCSARLKAMLRTGKVREAMVGERPVRTLFTKQQRAFLAEHAPEGVGIEDLDVLGPINVLKLKFAPRDYGRRLVAELWLYPDARGSSSCPPSAHRPSFRGRREDQGLPQRTRSGSDRRAADEDQVRARVLLPRVRARELGAPLPRPVTAPEPGARRAPSVPLEPFQEAYHGRKPFRSAHKPPLTTRYLPLVASLRAYNGSRLRTDAMAGVTVAALALPASMAYADIAGLPVTAGLYSLLLPLAVYALLGSAPWLVVGPESTIALLVAAGLAPLAVAGSVEYTTLAAALALAVGGFYLGARLLRLGWIADYFSQAVLVGYLTGVAILIILGQLGKLVGLSSDEDNAVIALADIVANLGEANAATVALAGASLLLLVVWRHFLPRFPTALLVVVLGILASWSLDLAAHGVTVAGRSRQDSPSSPSRGWVAKSWRSWSGLRAASSWSASPTRS